MFGSFRYFLYLCRVIIKAGGATRCSWSDEYLIPQKITQVMIELYLTKVAEDSEREQAGKTYARVSL